MSLKLFICKSVYISDAISMLVLYVLFSVQTYENACLLQLEQRIEEKNWGSVKVLKYLIL